MESQLPQTYGDFVIAFGNDEKGQVIRSLRQDIGRIALADPVDKSTVAHWLASYGWLSDAPFEVEQRYPDILTWTDRENNTLVHAAAQTGKMGWLMNEIMEKPELLGALNNRGQTPAAIDWENQKQGWRSGAGSAVGRPCVLGLMVRATQELSGLLGQTTVELTPKHQKALKILEIIGRLPDIRVTF